jgi:putative transposase
MGGYDPEIHQRRSIRLKAYDYAQPGSYFVTINTHLRVCTLGVVDGETVSLSVAGKIVAREIDRLSERFPGVQIDASVIMPNHIHAIISIV